LGCGAELPRDAHAPKPFTGLTPPAGVSRKTEKQVLSRDAGQGSLIAVLPDGSEGERFNFTKEAFIGRETGGMFAGDNFLSPRHARFRFEGKSLRVRDEGSLNGIYVRVKPDEPAILEDGSVFRIGQEIIRFEALRALTPQSSQRMGSPRQDYIGRITLITGRTTTGNSYPVPADGLYLGRERGDIIFPDDGYVSGLHCRVATENGRAVLLDVGSSNGTFLRIRSEVALEEGNVLLMGQQLYRIDY